MGRPKMERRIEECPTCHAVKELLPQRGTCKKCADHERDQKAYYAHQEQKIQRVKDWAARNPDKKKANKAASYQRHKAEIKAKNEAWAAANPERCKANAQAWRDRNRVHVRAMQARRYGLTPDAYKAMVAAQDGKCGVCQGIMDPPCVDHDHTTGAVRKLLCSRCNLMLGQIENTNMELIETALAYVEAHKPPVIQ